MGVKIQLFEAGAYKSDFCLWGWMKREVYKVKVNTRDELVARSPYYHLLKHPVYYVL
jgi:hypothetical protein